MRPLDRNRFPHLSPADLTKALAEAVRRFCRARHRYSHFNNGRSRTINFARLQDNTIAHTLYSLALQLEESAKLAVRTYENWVEEGVRFENLCYGDEQVISEKMATKMYDNWRIRAYVVYNCQRLHSIVEEARRNSKDLGAFDALMYQRHAVNILLDVTPNSWARTGSDSIVRHVAQVMRDNLHVEVALLSEDEALDRLIVMLELLGDEYEFLMARADRHMEQAINLLNA